MAQRRRVSNTPYIYDNTARDLQIRRQMEEPRRQMSHETRKNREKARHMSIGYVTFLMGALIACAAFLVNSVPTQMISAVISLPPFAVTCPISFPQTVYYTSRAEKRKYFTPENFHFPLFPDSRAGVVFFHPFPCDSAPATE